MSSTEEGFVPPRRNWVSFWSLLVLQTQNAFNDKAAQFLLIPMGAWLFKEKIAIPGLELMKYIEYILAVVIVSPFILFSPLAGWLSDRFSKTSVIRGASILQLIVLVWISAAICYHQIWLAIFGFFMLSVQSVLLSPGKRGIVKELIGHERLGFASGMMEITVVLAICGGQIITGFWFTNRLKSGLDGWASGYTPLLVFTAASVGALIVSYIIQRVPVQGHRKFKWPILFEHFGQLGELWKIRAIKLSAAGAAFFWGFAGYLNLAAINIAKQVTEGGDEFAVESALLMLAASVGIFLGGAMASLVCRKNIELGLIPLGGLVMVVGTLALAFTPMDSHWLKAWFVVAGAGGALLLVPLNANLQDLCPPRKRGKILAGLNLLDCLAGLFAALIQLGLVAQGVDFKWQFIGLAVLCILVTNYAAKLLPQHFVRLMGLSLFRMFYRVRSHNPVRIPKEGGVLLTPNHVSYIDAFILSCACPRKIRFLMFDGYFKHPWVGRFVRLFDTVPISQTRAKEAVRVAAEALEEGAVVCIFPEGQLARTGVMNEFKRGFEMIARKANCPVVPAAMDGLWGSIFSFERNKFIYKWPYRVRYGVSVDFGDPIPAEKADAGTVRRAVESLRAGIFQKRDAIANPMSLLGRGVKVCGHGVEGYQMRMAELRELKHDDQAQLVANALQIGEVNAIRRGQTVMIGWDELGAFRDALGIVFAQYFNLKVVLVHAAVSADELTALSKKHRVDHYLGGSLLGETWRATKLAGCCYEFSGEALRHHGVFPCYTTHDRVISMSMPHPEAITATNQHQEGHRPGTWGRLLPGFHVEPLADGVTLFGASTPEQGITITGVIPDESGMLTPQGEI
ncbi:MAG: MFS transporter [Akkermansiaceae bacterium]|nr:MFS transporter [Akkermansiaceae bacterium]